MTKITIADVKAALRDARIDVGPVSRVPTRIGANAYVYQANGSRVTFGPRDDGRAPGWCVTSYDVDVAL